MTAHLAQEVTTICSCWKVIRQDGVVMGFTDHDRPFIYDGVSYEAQDGFNRTAISNDGSYSVDNLDVTGFLSSDNITEEDMRNGVYNFAEVYVFVVNWKDLSATMGDVKLRRGWFGEIVITTDAQFTIELRGLTQALTHDFIENFSPECRADFCDPRCGLSLQDFSQIATVTGVLGKDLFEIAPLTIPSQGYLGGSITWRSGTNNGRAMEIVDFDTTHNQITLFEPMVYDIKVGDTLLLSTGCNKSRDNCKLYKNILNFRGEPDVPGQDEYLSYPDPPPDS